MGGGGTELSGPDLEKGIPLASIEPGKPLLGHAHGEGIIVVKVGADVRAIGASCTHYGGPLAEGLVVGDTVRCPWHHACFDLSTGEAIGAPALGSVACFDVVRTGDLVQVRAKKDAPRRKAIAAPASIVIVGAGAAGAACVEMLRKEGYDGPIAMLGAEEPGPVDRPNLSKDYLAGTAPEEWIPLGTRERYAELRVDLSPADPATAIDTAAKTVTAASGKKLPYGALLYAPGSEPVRLPIDGASLPHVFTLRALGDARGIIQRASGAKRAVVIGASFIGLEVAASLTARGIEVHVVAPDATPLGRILGDALGTFIRGVHEAKGTTFHLGTRPKTISATTVTLENGDRIDADLVVMGVGVRPRTALAEQAGLKVDGGVVVDEMLRTSAEHVWAAGDVARFPEAGTGELARIEHWVVAERQGQAAARAMLGNGHAFREVPFFWSAHHDVSISYVGYAPSWDSVTVHGSLERRDAAIAYSRGGKVLAVATIQRDAVSLAVEAAMGRGDWDGVRSIVSS
jgi:NADPH-dependent 2,4-dienoyl-CoA reductase/sulfur reductase-like enzyme/nitrite reductase/ring-hydroxylating ferredoxin subunit